MPGNWWSAEDAVTVRWEVGERHVGFLFDLHDPEPRVRQQHELRLSRVQWPDVLGAFRVNGVHNGDVPELLFAVWVPWYMSVVCESFRPIHVRLRAERVRRAQPGERVEQRDERKSGATTSE